ncbi:MAG TPA: GH116 family glycosyl-hydrolase [bacterium]|nr:GH116 family glycosyl-hydrolase [bacterium]
MMNCAEIWAIIAILVLTGWIVAKPVQAGQKSVEEWPVLKTYDADHLDRIAMPIGGIGTGTVSLAGNGGLRDWEIMNRPAKGFLAGPGGNQAPFFAVNILAAGKKSQTRGLMGPIPLSEYEGMDGRNPANHGIPRFRKCRFSSAYPFAQVDLQDDDLPIRVQLKAFNPLIPADAESSGIPIAVLRYEVHNQLAEPLTVSICGIMENFIGEDGSRTEPDWRHVRVPTGSDNNRNIFRLGRSARGLLLSSPGVDPADEAWGTLALTTAEQSGVTYLTGLPTGIWGEDLLKLWDDFSADGCLHDHPGAEGNRPMAALAVQKTIPANSSAVFSFYLTWHFPNRRAWAQTRVGNHYAEQYRDAWDVAERTVPQLPALEKKTVQWVTAFVNSDLPPEVKEAALFNLSTLRTQTCFRTADGRFFAFEGCCDRVGCCSGSCTHVWNYEQATPFLFAELAKSMRRTEFAHATDNQGLMSFRVQLPLNRAQSFGLAAADGQMGCIVKLYREWQHSGDESLLRDLWPHARRALSFAWIEGGWDGDVDGVMEGCQHNTMDVEYYGPNPQMQLWYLAALRAAAEMARALGDDEFSLLCRALFARGSEWTDRHLFNGEYYVHLITPPPEGQEIAPGLRVGAGAKDPRNPAYQLGEGCLVDQLVGQFSAHVCGLGYLVDPQNIKKTLQSILTYNYRPSMHSHFNNMRSYVLGEEAGLLMAAYPHSRPQFPFSYFNEVMTGFEYTAAVGMLYEGLVDEGVQCIRNIRARYDGRKRSPFDEAECGHHYARAMASWAAVPALSGFHYSAIDKSIRWAQFDGTHFWSNGSAYGTVRQSGDSRVRTLEIVAFGGEVSLLSLGITGFGRQTWESSRSVTPGTTLVAKVTANDATVGMPSLPGRDQEIVPVLPRPQIVVGDLLIRRQVFSDSLIVCVRSADPAADIHYTLNGQVPTSRDARYTKPLVLDRSCELKAIAVRKGAISVAVAQATFCKRVAVQKLSLLHAPAVPQSGAVEKLLFDGVRGSKNHADGQWVGFAGVDFVADIDLGIVQTINRLAVGALHKPDVGIYYPRRIDFWASDDGVTYRPVAELDESMINQLACCDNAQFAVEPQSLRSRYLRIQAKNIGFHPAATVGATRYTWLYIDELFIE